MAFPLLLPLLSAGLAIAGGVADYKAKSKQAHQARARELERQTLAIKQFVEEQKAREAELNLQMVQLRNRRIETEAIKDTQKGDIAMAAEAASSRALAAQASSGLEAGVGTFGNVIRDIGFEADREAGKVDLTAEFQNVQTSTEEAAAVRRSHVPEPHISNVAQVDNTNLMIGTGLSIASKVAGIGSRHMPVGGFSFGRKKAGPLYGPGF